VKFDFLKEKFKMVEDKVERDSSSASEDEEDMDTDEELQEAFAAGLIKPGLNSVLAPKESAKPKTNNIEGLKQKLAEFSQKMPWIERLDMINKPAPLAPELAYQEEQHAKRREKLLKGNKHAMALADDPVHNDFKREMLFYRQGQATVLASLERLRSMNIPTKRPDDYFAQMFKTDEHMQKIRTKLAQKQDEEERITKVRKLREMKKFGKQIQIEVQQKRQKEKKDMLDQVKKFRKGKTDSIDFLEDLDSKKGGKKKQGEKKQFKDKKFGFGGKKKGNKSNTKQSTDDISSYKPFKGHQKGGPGGKKKFGGAGGKSKVKRPGKQRRQQMKSKKK